MYRWSAAGEPERAVALIRRLAKYGFEPSLATYETLVWGFAQVQHTSPPRAMRNMRICSLYKSHPGKSQLGSKWQS